MIVYCLMRSHGFGNPILLAVFSSLEAAETEAKRLLESDKTGEFWYHVEDWSVQE